MSRIGPKPRKRYDPGRSGQSAWAPISNPGMENVSLLVGISAPSQDASDANKSRLDAVEPSANTPRAHFWSLDDRVRGSLRGLT